MITKITRRKLRQLIKEAFVSYPGGKTIYVGSKDNDPFESPYADSLGDRLKTKELKTLYQNRLCF